LAKQVKSEAEQARRFERAAREADADMSKEEFARVIGGLAKPKPGGDAEQGPKAEAKDDA
jgi:hypothetical protein